MGLLSNTDDDKKLLFRQYCKAQKKLGNTIISDIIEEIKLSSSEEWIVIEGRESVALLNAESKAGQDFWQAIQPFKGELKALMLIPAKGKLGFDVEICEDVIVEWEWDGDLLKTKKEDSAPTSTFTQKLSLDNMKVGNNSKTSTTKSSGNGTKRQEKEPGITPLSVVTPPAPKGKG